MKILAKNIPLYVLTETYKGYIEHEYSFNFTNFNIFDGSGSVN